MAFGFVLRALSVEIRSGWFFGVEFCVCVAGGVVLLHVKGGFVFFKCDLLYVIDFYSWLCY